MLLIICFSIHPENEHADRPDNGSMDVQKGLLFNISRTAGLALNGKVVEVKHILQERSLDPTKSYLQEDPSLTKFGVAFQSFFKVLICLGCGWCWLPDEIVGHLRNTHHFKVSSTEKENLLLTAKALGVCEQRDQVAIPKPGGPPVEGLLKQEGWKCKWCSYAAKSQAVAISHARQHEEALGAGTKRIQAATVQAFWKMTHRVYFAVEPSLGGVLEGEAAWELWLMGDAERRAKLQDGARPLRAEEIPLLVKRTGWHLHLDKWLWNTSEREKLKQMVALPKWSAAGLGSLQHICLKYLIAAREMAMGCDGYIMKALKQYPV